MVKKGMNQDNSNDRIPKKVKDRAVQERLRILLELAITIGRREGLITNLPPIKEKD